jgi:L-galactose dehydrogenase
MEYRTLGKTGLQVSILGYGASPLGSVFRRVKDAAGIRTVHQAIDLGINYIDCSPYYGETVAETVLGQALQDIPRDRYYLATKVGRYGDDVFDFSAQRVTRSVDESLQRLGVDHIDIIQCHDIEFEKLDVIVNETLPALHRLKETGKVRFVGITGFPLKALEYVLERAELDTVLSYCHYTLNDTSLTALLPRLKKKNAGIVNASPLGMGLLTERGIPAWHPATPEIQQGCRKAVEFCRKMGTDIARVALQYAVANPEIHTTLVGTASPENLKRNVECIQEPIDREILLQVLSILEPIHNQSWESGLPENND